MDTVIVTGGAGFIGGCLVRQLVAEQRFHVVNLDLLTYAGNLDSLAEVADDPCYTFVQGDICDAALVESLLEKHQPTAIINLAAESHVDRSIDGPAAFVQTNVVGTFTLLDAARNYWKELPDGEQGGFRFLHVSTDEVFGSLGDDGAFHEATPYAPNSPYSASKAGSDHLVRAYHHTFGLPTLITNCSNNYGPFQFPEKLLPLMILNAMDGKPLPVYGDGQNVRDWLFVDDHAAALRLVLEKGKPGETYCIGGENERTNLQVVQAICDACDELLEGTGRGPCRDLITFVSDRPGHDFRYAIDASKIRQELGWSPTRDFETGIAETVKWYQENGAWVERLASGGYQRDRLGLANSIEG